MTSQIDRYRGQHLIRPTTRGRDGARVCAIDGLAIHPNQTGARWTVVPAHETCDHYANENGRCLRCGAERVTRFRHDPTEVREAAEEAGRLEMPRIAR